MTADATPEAAMRRACDFILAGDIFSAMSDLTPEAMNEAMAFGGAFTGVPIPESYAIESHEQQDGVHRFVVCFRTALRDVRGWAVWQQVEGAWKITALGIE